MAVDKPLSAEKGIFVSITDFPPMKWPVLLLLLLYLMVQGIVSGQNVGDSARANKVYQEIEAVSQKHKITRLIHQAVIRPVRRPSVFPARVIKNMPEWVFSPFEGRPVRKVIVQTTKPFGYSLVDETVEPKGNFVKAANSLHVRTRSWAIRSYLLVHEGDIFDSVLMAESERLIRNLAYVHDVRLNIQELQGSDSLDIVFRVSDVWSIDVDGDISPQSGSMTLQDRNFMGFGHTLLYTYKQYFGSPRSAYRLGYTLPNIRNTGVQAYLGHAVDESGNFDRRIQFDRPFLSPVTHWAGGILLSDVLKPQPVYLADTSLDVSIHKVSFDSWLGYSWQLFHGKTQGERGTRLIAAARFSHYWLYDKSLGIAGMSDWMQDYSQIMGQIGLSVRQYVKTTHLFKYGLTEYVPVGAALYLATGLRFGNGQSYYYGASASWGNYLGDFYISPRIDYGTFTNAGTANQGVVNASLLVFSPIYRIGGWSVRQFVRPDITLGINRTPFDVLSLNGEGSFGGFNSSGSEGTSRLRANLQTQAYAPWKLLGFRFGPYLSWGAGMIGRQGEHFAHSRVYTFVGAGILIRNDYLVFNQFQISFAFYPNIPGKGNYILKFNPIRSTNFGLPDFVVSTPGEVEFK